MADLQLNPTHACSVVSLTLFSEAYSQVSIYRIAVLAHEWAILLDSSRNSFRINFQIYVRMLTYPFYAAYLCNFIAFIYAHFPQPFYKT